MERHSAVLLLLPADRGMNGQTQWC